MNPPQTERLGYGFGELIGKMKIPVPPDNKSKENDCEEGLLQNIKNEKEIKNVKTDNLFNQVENLFIEIKEHDEKRWQNIAQ